MKDPNRRRHRGESFNLLVGEHREEEEEDFGGKDKTFLSSSSLSFSKILLLLGFGSSRGFGSSSSVWKTVSLVLFCSLLLAVASSTFQLFGVSFRPVLISTWQHRSALNAAGSDGLFSSASGEYHHRIHHAVTFPDQLLLFLTHPPFPSQFPPLSTLNCLYTKRSASSTNTPDISLRPISVDSSDPKRVLVRCPIPPDAELDVSVGDGVGHHSPPIQAQFRRWDFVAYESLLDLRDNSTVIFVKGLNLRADRLSDATRFECVFGWQFDKPKYLLTSPVLTAAQEIVRCKTPVSVLRRSTTDKNDYPAVDPVFVSVRTKGKGVAGITPSVAHPVPINASPSFQKHTMCVCSMVRNQARFLKEWITYHARIGVERWFLYDNNSNDSLSETVRSIDADGYNVSRHSWPWVKTQEAGFAHCALRARESCEWVGFIDVDEFLHLPLTSSPHHNISLLNVLSNHSTNYPWVGELRSACYSFGPSGHEKAPKEGVMVGYTCRVVAPERHKSIVRPDALCPSLVNVVHHFHLRDGFEYENLDRSVMVINHYKYQAWEVFKEKFYRRVATYVADWQEEENVGSKDRAPGLGTKPVEPPDWPTRFCETNDTGLKDWVLTHFSNPQTGLLPWWVVD